MELSIQLTGKNVYPVSGFLIKDGSVQSWLMDLEALEVKLEDVSVYALPGSEANTLWGCYVEVHQGEAPGQIGLNTYTQCAEGIAVIPEHCKLFPKLSRKELEQLFKGKRVLIHPEVGFFELEIPVNWAEQLAAPNEEPPALQIPENPLFIPSQIKSFRVKAKKPEDALEQMEKTHFPKNKNLEDKPLNLLEKARLGLYKVFGGNGSANDTKPRNGGKSGEGDSGVPGLGFLGAALGFLGSIGNRFAERMERDLDELERRNKKAMDKLLDMLKQNPEEGLQYAIPLDEQGTSRGDGNMEFALSKFWSSFSLFGGSASSSGRSLGGSINLGDNFNTLRDQYEKTASELIDQGKHEKAAFVYFKLLKNSYKAVETLKKGQLFAEAAAFYLKHLKDKPAAASCYEEGRMYEEAILLYEELKNYEKAGDLCMKANRKKQAMRNYQQLADEYMQEHKYVKGALVYKYKMQHPEASQQLLMQGWQYDIDAVNCLEMYLSNIEEEGEFGRILPEVYQQQVHPQNQRKFLEVLKMQFFKREASKTMIKDMAYEVVAEEVQKDADVVSELKAFNSKDQEFGKDVFRFKLHQRNKKK